MMKAKKPNKIPIKEAINSGAWYHCFCEKGIDGVVDSTFRLKVFSFEKVNLSDVDSPERIDQINCDLENGEFWIMHLEIINLSKQEGFVQSLVHLLDKDEYEFHRNDDGHLSLFSNYAKKTGLVNLYGQKCFPKIKRKGAIAFFLPKEESEYFLSVAGGNIREV